jgi:hypothetical protein
VTGQLRAALGELSFLWAEVMSAAARYEAEGDVVSATGLARKLDQLDAHAARLKGALKEDLRLGRTVPIMPAVVEEEHVQNLRGFPLPADGQMTAGLGRHLLEVGLGLRPTPAVEALIAAEQGGGAAA